MMQTVKQKLSTSTSLELLRHFEPWEFRCNDGCGLGYEDMIWPFLVKLDFARDLAGIPFVILSSIRCPKHNREVGGVADSAHLKGLAVDIEANGSRQRYLIVSSLLKAGFHRVGLYPHLPHLIHVDDDPSKARNVMWFNGMRRKRPLPRNNGGLRK